MNWGKSIIVAFILFAVFIGTLVAVCVRQEISLVSNDYYKEEIEYGNQITALTNSLHISKPRISLTRDTLRLQLENSANIERGELKLFCPSNEKMDRRFAFKNSGTSTWTYALTGLQKGMYRAKLSWTVNGKEFYYEEIINL